MNHTMFSCCLICGEICEQKRMARILNFKLCLVCTKNLFNEITKYLEKERKIKEKEMLLEANKNQLNMFL